MTDEAIQSLYIISDQLNRYLALVIFIFGAIGNLLNCMILSQRTLQFNPCALLFLTSSLASLISILFGIPTRILSGWHVDPTSTVDWICKLRVFVVFSTRTMSIWLITMASIERWLLSSVEASRREMSNVKNVKRAIIIIVILSIVAYIHMPFCYVANLTDAPLQCYGKAGPCRLMTDLTYGIITILIPLSLMITFGLVIISNVHKIQNRVRPTATMRPMGSNIPRRRRRKLKLKKVDHHLLRMLLFQVFVLTIFCIPQAIQKFYITWRPFNSISSFEAAMDHFLYNIETILAFVASGMPFYIYTISGGSVFRKASVTFMKGIYQRAINDL